MTAVKNRKLHKFGFFFVLLCLAAQVAAQNASYSVNLARDGDYMISTAVTDTNYAMGGQHTAYATLTTRSPRLGRVQTLQAFQAPYVSVTDWMSIGLEDGTWTAENEPKEWCPVGLVYYTYPLAASYADVPKWVRLLDIPKTWTPEKIGPGQLSQLQATVQSSLGVPANTQVAVYSSHTFNPQDLESKLTCDGWSKTATVGQGAGGTATFKCSILSGTQISQEGTLTTTTYITGVNPQGPTVENPAASNQNSTLQVKSTPQ